MLLLPDSEVDNRVVDMSTPIARSLATKSTADTFSLQEFDRAVAGEGGAISRGFAAFKDQRIRLFRTDANDSRGSESNRP